MTLYRSYESKKKSIPGVCQPLALSSTSLLGDSSRLEHLAILGGVFQELLVQVKSLADNDLWRLKGSREDSLEIFTPSKWINNCRSTESPAERERQEETNE